MKTRFALLVFFFVLVALMPVVVRAEEPAPLQGRQLEVIDTPTAEVLDHYGYFVGFRFGKDGNLQTKTAFGVLPRLNIGFGLDGEKVIGTQDARLNKPTLNVKFRMFDGKGILPALTLGFDDQGYVFNRATDEYEQKQKGLYLVASEEFLVPGLMIHAGANKYDFSHHDTNRAWLATSYTYQQTIGLMFEWDHATHYEERRLNFGLKYFVTPLFTVDAIGRNVPATDGTKDRETERVVRLNYTGSF